MTIVDVVVIACDCVSGAALIGAGGYAVALHRRARAARRRATSGEALDAALQRWRLEKRLLRARALQAWQADFDALLPPAPAPACTSSEHNHVENYRIGSQRVERICVVRPPYSVGGITAQEAVQALQRLAVPQRAVMLSPGERVLSRDEIESLRRQAEARVLVADREREDRHAEGPGRGEGAAGADEDEARVSGLRAWQEHVQDPATPSHW